jgi:hypothetical protein
MEKTKRWIKNNLLFFVSIIILMLSIIFSAVMFYNFRIQANDFNTRVSHIYLGNDDSQYESILENAYNDFSEQAEYEVVYQNHSYTIDLSHFEIATDDIIEVLVLNQNNHAYFDVSNEIELINNLENVFGENIVNQLSTNLFINAIANQLSVFNYFVIFNLENYFIDSYQDSILNSENYLVSDNDIVNELPAELTINIQGNSTFSILDALNEYDFSNKTLSYLSSLILDLTLESHFQHYMFYEPETDPSWLETDVAVQVLKNNDFDFVFNNTYSQNYLIEFVLSGTTLEASLIGSPYINSFELTKTSITVTYDTIYEADLTLTDPVYMVSDDANQTVYEKVVTPGVDGEIVRYIRTVTYQDNTQMTYEIFHTETQESTDEVILQNIVVKVGG